MEKDKNRMLYSSVEYKTKKVTSEQNKLIGTTKQQHQKGDGRGQDGYRGQIYANKQKLNFQR